MSPGHRFHLLALVLPLGFAAPILSPHPTSAASIGLGEIQLEGTVQSVQLERRRFVLLADAVTTASSDVIKLAPPHPKVVLVDAQTDIHTWGDPSDPAALSDLSPGMPVVVVGRDTGEGKELPARLVGTGRREPAALFPLPEAPYEGSLRPLPVLQLGQGAPITQVLFSPDGKYLLTGGMDRVVVVREASTGRILASLRGHTERILALAIAPSGSRIATSSFDGVHFWDMQTGRQRGSLASYPGAVIGLAFTPDSRMLITASQDKAPQIWSTAAGDLHKTLQGEGARSFAMAADGAQAAAGQEDGSIHIFAPLTGQSEMTMKSQNGPISSLAFSPDGKLLAAGCARGTELWNTQTGALSTLLEGKAAVSVAFSPDGKTLASATGENAVQLWDVGAGVLSASLETPEPMNVAAFSPDGETIAAGGGFLGAPGVLRLWQFRSRRLRASYPGETDAVTAAAFSPDGSLLAVCRGGIAQLWSWPDRKLKLSTPWHAGWAQVLAFAPDGKSFAVGSGDGSVRLWDTTAGALKSTLGADAAPISLAFSGDGKTLAEGCADFKVRVWDASSGALKTTIPMPRGLAAMIAISPDGKTIATGDLGENAPRVFDAQTGKIRLAIKGHEAPLLSIAISPDGRQLASTAWDATVRLWNLQTGDQSASFDTGEGSRLVAFSSDGSGLAAEGQSGQVRWWNLATPSPRTQAPTAAALAVFPPDIQRPFFIDGPGLGFRHPKDGRLLATLLPVPAAPPAASSSDNNDEDASDNAWLVLTPEGCLDIPDTAAPYLAWSQDGRIYAAERFLRRYEALSAVQGALQGRAVIPPDAPGDLPPLLRFPELHPGAALLAGPLKIHVQALAENTVDRVELFVNGKLAPPQAAAASNPVWVSRPADTETNDHPHYRRLQDFEIPVIIPHAAEIHLRAVAYDADGIGSDPVEIVLKGR